MEERLRQGAHYNLYHIFQQDKAGHPMPAERVSEILRLIQILLNQSKGVYQ